MHWVIHSDSMLYNADWTINCNFCETDEEQTAFCVDWSFCGLMAHICLWILLLVLCFSSVLKQ